MAGAAGGRGPSRGFIGLPIILDKAVDEWSTRMSGRLTVGDSVASVIRQLSQCFSSCWRAVHDLRTCLCTVTGAMK
jgi:hypothetical protein